MATPYKIIHLIPYDGIGGVEQSARSTLSLDHIAFHLRVKYLSKRRLDKSIIGVLWTFASLVSSCYRLCIKPPDVLIVSLWRCCIAAYFISLIRPNVKIVLFLHLENHAHFIDRLFSTLVAKRSKEIWSDSLSTLDSRMKIFKLKERPLTRIVSFKLESVKALPVSSPKPVFIFWGRLNFQKNIAYSLRLIYELNKLKKDCKFLIIGPDGGERRKLEILSDSLNLNSVVTFFGPMSFAEIKEKAALSTFYIQLSRSEGMAISVIEAMQLGLIPVVTSVGEISAYCFNDYNSIVVDNIEQALGSIKQVLQKDSLFRMLRQNAIRSWESHPTYNESIINCCSNLCTKLDKTI